MSILRASTAQLVTCALVLEEQATVTELNMDQPPARADIEFIGALRSGAAFIDRELTRRKS